jgi:uncharacterized RDD family membrane protein YckC
MPKYVECPICNRKSSKIEQHCKKCGKDLSKVPYIQEEDERITKIIEDNWDQYQNNRSEWENKAPTQNYLIEEYRYAPMGYRIAGFFIDEVILWIVAFLTWVAFSNILGMVERVSDVIVYKSIFAVLYFIYFQNPRRRKTLGMAAVRITLTIVNPLPIAIEPNEIKKRYFLISLIKSFELFLVIDLIFGYFFSKINWRNNPRYSSLSLEKWKNQASYSQKITGICVIKE